MLSAWAPVGVGSDFLFGLSIIALGVARGGYRNGLAIVALVLARYNTICQKCACCQCHCQRGYKGSKNGLKINIRPEFENQSGPWNNLNSAWRLCHVTLFVQKHHG